MTKPEPLAYRELITPNRRYGPRVLQPREIPIHPLVYENAACFTQEFLDRIRGRIVESMREDDMTIREALGTDIGLIIGDSSISHASREVPYNRMQLTVDPEKKEIGAELGATSTYILRHLPRELLVCESDLHPMSLERLREYSFDSSDPNYLIMHTWYQHNIEDQGWGVFHFLRNFAILFNNVGLESI